MIPHINNHSSDVTLRSLRFIPVFLHIYIYTYMLTPPRSTPIIPNEGFTLSFPMAHI